MVFITKSTKSNLKFNKILNSNFSTNLKTSLSFSKKKLA